MAETNRIRVMIVDDHEVVRAGLHSFLKHRPNIEVVGEAGGVTEALDQVAKLRPTVVVMDMRLSDGNGADACRLIKDSFPEVSVLMLTSFSDTESVQACIIAGASGYILKEKRGADLVKAIETVGSGGSRFDADMVKGVVERLRAHESNSQPAPVSNILNERETAIIHLIAEGRTNREIAQEIFLSEKTVKNYVSSILGKLGVNRRSQAAAFAVNMGSASASRTTPTA